LWHQLLSLIAPERRQYAVSHSLRTVKLNRITHRISVFGASCSVYQARERVEGEKEPLTHLTSTWLSLGVSWPQSEQWMVRSHRIWNDLCQWMNDWKDWHLWGLEIDKKQPRHLAHLEQ
jgi:hypothetical protein